MGAYVDYDDYIHVRINADDTTSRQSRAAQIGAVKRLYQLRHSVTLELRGMTYSETRGFLKKRSSAWYNVVHHAF